LDTKSAAIKKCASAKNAERHWTSNGVWVAYEPRAVILSATNDFIKISRTGNHSETVREGKAENG
jgi:hypothetical protein